MFHFIRVLHRLATSPRPIRRSSPSRRWRPRVELLEDRTVPSVTTFTDNLNVRLSPPAQDSGWIPVGDIFGVPIFFHEKAQFFLQASGKLQISYEANGDETVQGSLGIGGSAQVDLELGAHAGFSVAGQGVDAFIGAFVQTQVSLQGSMSVSWDKFTNQTTVSGFMGLEGVLEGGLRGYVTAHLPGVDVTGQVDGGLKGVVDDGITLSSTGNNLKLQNGVSFAVGVFADVVAQAKVAWWTVQAKWEASSMVKAGPFGFQVSFANPFTSLLSSEGHKFPSPPPPSQGGEPPPSHGGNPPLPSQGGDPPPPSHGGNPPPSQGGSSSIYIVKSGDTLSAIAQSHGISLAALEAANTQIANYNLIYPGEHISLPQPQGNPAPSQSKAPPSPAPSRPVYVVKGGDTLSAIAARNHVTLKQLEAANPQIRNYNLIYPGERIYLH